MHKNKPKSKSIKANRKNNFKKYLTQKDSKIVVDFKSNAKRKRVTEKYETTNNGIDIFSSGEK